MADMDAQFAKLEQEFAEFVYVISHDLSAPLRESANFARLLEEKYGSEMEEKARDYLAHVIKGSRRAQAMLEGLAHYSRLSTRADERREGVDASSAFRRCVQTLHEAIDGRKAEIIAGNLPHVYADPAQLEQLFRLLLENSLKFTSSAQPARIEIQGREIGKGWRFSVRDNGIGIAPRHFEEVFKPLRQLHSDGNSGMGMGLAMAKRIVERHGGRIWVESEPGQGSVFWFTLSHKNGEEREAA